MVNKWDLSTYKVSSGELRIIDATLPEQHITGWLAGMLPSFPNLNPCALGSIFAGSTW